MITTIYIVEYCPDYEGCAAIVAFTTKELAEQHAKTLGKDYEVTEIDVLDAPPVLTRVWQAQLAYNVDSGQEIVHPIGGTFETHHDNYNYAWPPEGGHYDKVHYTGGSDGVARVLAYSTISAADARHKAEEHKKQAIAQAKRNRTMYARREEKRKMRHQKKK